jgi:16S rRNA processing protein RimM
MSAGGRGWLRAGRIGSPHGLDGTVHVNEASPQLLVPGASVVVGDREMTVERRAGTDRRPIVRFAGCGDRADAEALRGREILVARDEAPPLEPDEWWAEDLEGCTVHDGAQTVGTVRRMLALPSCEVLEVERANGAGDLLVPLVRDAVREVDLDRRAIEIDLVFLGESGA